MRCPLLCKQKKEINGKWCLPCGYERHQQRNWLGSFVFNCLESVPLHPNTTPYYQKYAPNFRNNPRATRPSWLQEPEQARPQRVNKLPTKLEPEPEIFKQKSTQTEPETNRTDKYEHKKKESLREYHLIQPFLKQKINKNLKTPADDIITTFGTYRNREDYQKKKPIHKNSQRLPEKHESELATNQVITDRYTLSTDKKKKQMVQERNLILQFCPQKNAKNIQSKEQPKTVTTKFGTYSQGSIEPQPKFTKKFTKMLQGTKVPEFNALLKSRHGLRADTKQEAPTLHRSNRFNQYAMVPDSPVAQKKKIKAAPRDTEALKQAPLKSEPKQAPLKSEPKQAPLRAEPKQVPLKTEAKQAPLKTKDYIQPAYTKTFEKMLQDVNPEMPEQHRLLRSQHFLAIKGRDRKKRSASDVVGIQPKFTATFNNMLKHTNANEPEEYKLIKSRYAIKRKANVKKKLIDNGERKRASVGSSLTRSGNSIIRKIKYRPSRRGKIEYPKGSLDSFDVWNLKYASQTKSRIPEKLFYHKEIIPRSPSAMSSHSSSNSLANEEQEVTSPSPSVGYILPAQNSFKLSLYKPIRYPQHGEAQRKRVSMKRYSSRVRKIYNIRLSSSKTPSSLRSRKIDSLVGLAPSNVEAEIDSTDQPNDQKRFKTTSTCSFYDFQSSIDIISSKSGQWLSEKRAQLAAQIAELMKHVEIREDVPLRKKRERNFVREAQTQLWKTKPPRNEKIAKKKRSKFPTKLEKLRIPSDSKTGSLKPLVIRRYRRKAELQPTKHRTECTCAACNTCKMFKLGKMEADTPLIREMKAKGRRMQLQNYYRLLLKREAWKCKRLAQSVYRSGKEQPCNIISPCTCRRRQQDWLSVDL